MGSGKHVSKWQSNPRLDPQNEEEAVYFCILLVQLITYAVTYSIMLPIIRPVPVQTFNKSITNTKYRWEKWLGEISIQGSIYVTKSIAVQLLIMRGN